jgi:hypothetical protein
MWTAHPAGYVRLELHLDGGVQQGSFVLGGAPPGEESAPPSVPPVRGRRSAQQAGDPPAQVRLALRFDSRRLDTAYCGSYAPPGVWTLGMADDPAYAFSTEDVPLGKLVTLYRRTAEAVTVAPHEGWIERLSIRGGASVAVEYAVAAPHPGELARASWYLLLAPVRERRTVRRAVFPMYNPQEVGGPAPFVEFPRHRDAYFPGTTHQSIREWADQGYTYLVFHDNWQTWEEGSNAHYGAHRPENEPHLRALMRAARARGMKIVFYVGLHNEQYTTAFNRSSGGRYVAQCRPDRPETWPKPRRVMCLETPYFEHQLSDVDYVLDDLGADGVYFDWMCLNPCFKRHGYHDVPANSLRRMIEMIDYVHGRGAEVFIHPGEEGLAPWLMEACELTVVGERPWSAITWANLRPLRERLEALDGAPPSLLETEAHGPHPRLKLCPFDRWTSNTGHVALISAAWKEDDAEFVAAAFAAGFSPLAYKSSGEATAQLARRLAPFPLEAMPLYTGDELGVTADDGIAVVAFRGAERLIVLAIGRAETHGHVRVPPSALPPGMSRAAGGLDLPVRLTRNEVAVFAFPPEV